VEGDGREGREEEDIVERGGNLKWISEEMIMVANMENRAMCKRCKQARVTREHLEEVHSAKCAKFNLEQDLDRLMEIRQGRWKEMSADNKKVVDELKDKYQSVYKTFNGLSS